jgi:hypothetical protein
MRALALEARHERRRLLGQDVLEALDGDVDVEVEVPPAVDGAHATFADLRVEHAGFEDLVALDFRHLAQQRIVTQRLLVLLRMAFDHPLLALPIPAPGAGDGTAGSRNW